MMADPLAAYFAEGVSEDEQLGHLRALAAGQHALLTAMLDRLTSYHDLLELELEERPAGRLYLQEASNSLARARDVVEGGAALAELPAATLESLDLKVLLRGLAGRLRKIKRAEITLAYPAPEPEEVYIRGRVYLLQQAFFDLVGLLASSGKPTANLALHLAVAKAKLDEEFFRARKTARPAGEYYLVTLGPSDRSDRLAEFGGLGEKLVACPALARLPQLAYAVGVLRQHGGELLLEKGSALPQAFLLAVPQRAGAGMFGEATLDEASLRGTETILLVDDEAIIWDVVIDMLQGLGYTVLLAENGADCIEIYRENPGTIDLVLLDMVMPELNGREAFFALKALNPKVRVLLQSGYVAEEDARDVLEAGAAGFLRKPYRLAHLARKLRELLAR